MNKNVSKMRLASIWMKERAKTLYPGPGFSLWNLVATPSSWPDYARWKQKRQKMEQDYQVKRQLQQTSMLGLPQNNIARINQGQRNEKVVTDSVQDSDIDNVISCANIGDEGLGQVEIVEVVSPIFKNVEEEHASIMIC